MLTAACAAHDPSSAPERSTRTPVDAGELASDSPHERSPQLEPPPPTEADGWTWSSESEGELYCSFFTVVGTPIRCVLGERFRPAGGPWSSVFVELLRADDVVTSVTVRSGLAEFWLDAPMHDGLVSVRVFDDDGPVTVGVWVFDRPALDVEKERRTRIISLIG